MLSAETAYEPRPRAYIQAPVLASLGASGIGAEAVHRVLDAVPVPALLIDRSCFVRHTNPAALQLGNTHCLVIAGGRVCRFAGAASETFDAVAARALGGRSSVVAVTMTRGERLSLWRVSVVPMKLESAAMRTETEAVMLLLEPPLTSQDALPLLERLFGLTAAEARVLALLLDDRRPKEIARDLDIAVTTVRSHLKALFLKTGARCQSELVGLALFAA